MKSVMRTLLLLLLAGAISSQAAAKTVTLSWDPSPSDISGYRIYYDSDSSTAPFDGGGATEGGSPIDVGDVLTYTIHGLSDTDDHYFAVTAYDDSGNESAYSNAVHSPPVAVANTPPVLTGIGNRTVLENAALAIALTATDSDGDALTFSVADLPDGAGFNSSTGAFEWTPGFTQSGIYNVTFSVSDGRDADAETVRITVTNVNRAPVLSTIGTHTVAEGSQLTFTINAADPDGDALSYGADDLPAGAAFNPATRQFSWTPDYDGSDNTRVYPVSFTVSDGSADDSELVTINVTNVNRPPEIATFGALVFSEGDSINFSVNASDPDNNSLTYSAANLPEGAVFTPSTRSFSWIPGPNQAGSYSVVFTVSDGLLAASETAVITIADGNEAPVLTPIGSQTVAEGSLLSFTVAATDENGDALTFSASGLPAGAVFDASRQQFNWTPEYSQAGHFTVEFSVTDGVLSASEAVAVAVTNTNRAPQINGTPDSTVMATTGYSFAPAATDPDNDALAFSIDNKPVWAAFDESTGALSGTPSEAQLGVYPGIAINVSDGVLSTTLAPFSIEVTAYVHQDSDGDGILDHLDAFPHDDTEWEDSDGDSLGNNADTDDDNDGVSDVRDGFPLDAGKAGWVVTATATSGGFITPEGQTSILYGGSQAYELTPMAGYYVNDLLVDNVSVGLASRYEFINIDRHHTITAVFSPIPDGLSYDPLSPGLIGVERVDGGDDSNNFVDGKPKQDLDYRFGMTLRDDVAADQRRVYVVLNDYKFPMVLTSGALSGGAEYAFVTRLGPAFSHRYHFVVEDTAQNQLWRYPQTGDLPGPNVEMLNGRNVLGIAAAINAYALDALEAFGNKAVYRWNPDSGPNGSFKLADSGAPITSGEGYVLKKTSGGTLPDRSMYAEIDTQAHPIEVKTGWNLIGNPYRGQVALADIEVRVGDGAAVPWLTAVENNLVVDGIHSYLGEDWGGVNEFAGAGGNRPAQLVPWIGYWVYINPNAEPISLLVPKPLQ